MKIHLDKVVDAPESIELEDTVYECNVCKRNIPLSALKSSEELQEFNHQIIDSVLICSNVTTNSIDVTDASILLPSIDDAECIDDGQQIIISLSDMKHEMS